VTSFIVKSRSPSNSRVCFQKNQLQNPPARIPNVARRNHRIFKSAAAHADIPSLNHSIAAKLFSMKYPAAGADIQSINRSVSAPPNTARNRPVPSGTCARSYSTAPHSAGRLRTASRSNRFPVPGPPIIQRSQRRRQHQVSRRAPVSAESAPRIVTFAVNAPPPCAQIVPVGTHRVPPHALARLRQQGISDYRSGITRRPQHYIHDLLNARTATRTTITTQFLKL